MTAIFGEILRFGQANGPEISLKVFGDEHYARYEDLQGYSVVYDEELGVFCYARLAAGHFRSTGTPLSQPVPQGLVRHLQESQETIAALAAARKLRRAAMAGGAAAAEEVVRTFGPNQGLLTGRVLSIGAVRGLTILVNFADLTSTVTRADVDDMLNGANYTRTLERRSETVRHLVEGSKERRSTSSFSGIPSDKGRQHASRMESRDHRGGSTVSPG